MAGLRKPPLPRTARSKPVPRHTLRTRSTHSLSVYYIRHGSARPPVSDASPPDTYSLSRLEAPATTVWIGDGDGVFAIDGFSTQGIGAQFADSAPPVEQWHGYSKLGHLVARHTGFCNILWCDGHVKAVTIDYLNSHKSNLPDAPAPVAPGGGVLSLFTVQADPD